MVRFARGSLPWLLVPVMLAAFFGAMGHRTGSDIWYWLAIAALLLLGLFLAFFRDPVRPIANGVASPADGKVRGIDSVLDADVGNCSRLSIFMSPKDVHVNRSPLDGTVVSLRHVEGSHVPAFKKESERNERVEIVIDTVAGRIKVILIAGTVARRIVPYVKDGQSLAKGQRIALIRFGSRCDFLFPEGRVAWSVKAGDQLQAGASRVGDLS